VHYYSSQVRGLLPPADPSDAMQQLSRLALQYATPSAEQQPGVH
jgi:hypothetical protein